MSGVELDDDQSSVVSFPLPREAYLKGPPSAVMSNGPSVISTMTHQTIQPPHEANINFKPTTTAISKNSKLKLHVLLDSTIYTAGGTLNGRLVLTCSTSRSVKLGEISAELTAYEELSTREYTATQSFLSSRLVFQGSNLPPSNAVHGARDENGFWLAKKGKTTFPFSFKIPIDAPSSVVFGSVASLRYVVTGVMQLFYNNREDTIFKSKEAFVVEAWDGQNPEYKQSVEGMNMKQLWMGGNGPVMLEGTLIETLFTSGGNVSAQVRVRNDTKRRVQGIKLGILQKLIILANKNKKEADDTKVVSETVAEEWFKNKDFLFDCGEDRTTTVNLHVPNTVRTIRNTALFEVTCHIVVSLYLGPFTKDLTVELPASICHSASLQPPPVANVELNHFPNHYNMIDETRDFFVEDIRKDDTEELIGSPSQPVDIPQRTQGLPWTNAATDQDAYRGRHSPTNNSAGSYILGSASPKKLGSLASSILGRGTKQTPSSSPTKLIPKSPPLAPASPYAYIPAIERVRYLAFPTQQQAAIQGRRIPQSSTPSVGYGIYSNVTVNTPPAPGSDCEYLLPEPNVSIQKWLENQQHPISCSESPERESVVSNSVDASPWAKLNRTQEVANSTISHRSSPSVYDKQQQNAIPIPIPVSTANDLPQDTFRRNDSLVSSPTGPSGLTLLMKQKSSSPPSVIDQFANTTNNNMYPMNSAYNHIPKGRPLPKPHRPLPIPPSKNTESPGQEQIVNEKPAKSRYLQVPGVTSSANEISEEFANPGSNDANANAGGIGGLSSLLKWGTSWMGYGSTEAQNKEETIIKEEALQQSSINNINEKKEIASATTNPNIIQPIKSSNPDKSALTSSPNKLVSTSNPDKASLHVTFEEITPKSENLDSTAIEPPSDNKISESSTPPPPPTRPITKASIFAVLGQKPLGTSPPPIPIKNLALRKYNPSGNNGKELAAARFSPPKQKGLPQVARKPLSENKFLNDDDKVAVTAAETETEYIDEKQALVLIENVENDLILISNSNETVENKNNVEDIVKETNSIPIINSNNETSASVTSSSPPPYIQSKITAAPTTYVNTTLPKPIIAFDKMVKRRRKKVGVENISEEGLTAKITEPPKQALSPRILNLMNQFNNGGGDASSGSNSK
ncbi:1495_t:CDS:2 [Ambispora gerdemannii]|uniref:1495_t:CDS:1 n=1 Tax=Ambispora gerdemannii TaxID=144530 RepID=A0A9N8YKX8_9GLOM|nr:1495_t:CDS:2 [Ambispora gerdemannii]